MTGGAAVGRALNFSVAVSHHQPREMWRTGRARFKEFCGAKIRHDRKEDLAAAHSTEQDDFVQKIIFLFATILAVALLSDNGARAESSAGATPAQRLFFENVKKLCGERFEGVTEFPDDPKHDFAGKKLAIEVETCTEREIRIPFRVGDDTSRTWVLTLTDKGLLLKHDHRHADGTPDKVTMYGGWATNDGTATRQQFAADEETAKMIPEAATNVWTLTIGDDQQQFRYVLERNGEPRYSALLKRAEGR